MIVKENIYEKNSYFRWWFGVYTAKHLQKLNIKDYEIELISDNNYFIFQPLLPEVASGTIYSSDAVTPIRQCKSIK